MPSDNDTEFATRLAEVLDHVVPSPAPVAAVLQEADMMRRNRRILIAAGVTAAGIAAVVVTAVLPGLGGPGGAAGGSHRRSPAPSAGRAVIAQGSIAGQPWRIVVDKRDGRLCAGVAGLQRTCTGLRAVQRDTPVAALSGALVRVPGARISNGPPVWNLIFGTVRPQVTSMVFRLADGRTYRLHPVRFAGYRWVGLIMTPSEVGVQEAIAYSGATELGYSVPFVGGEGNMGTYFVSWHRPGQPGPVEATRYVATGGSNRTGWSALVLAGPWGYCVVLQVPSTGARQDCFAAGSLASGARVIMHAGAAPAVPRWIVGTARPGVAYLRLSLAGGGTSTVRAVDVSGQRFYAMEIGTGPAITAWGAFDAAGHRLYGGRGAPDAG